MHTLWLGGGGGGEGEMGVTGDRFRQRNQRGLPSPNLNPRLKHMITLFGSMLIAVEMSLRRDCFGFFLLAQMVGTTGIRQQALQVPSVFNAN